ncbi:unnamed protein product [Vicia faba]|uniref:Uncharacterized protein n=1 Tax=Vicia faba TaxID=3906 RepID=A0AAV0Z2C2_VICFA|nr:unnamed protein product [Vicia faba]
MATPKIVGPEPFLGSQHRSINIGAKDKFPFTADDTAYCLSVSLIICFTTNMRVCLRAFSKALHLSSSLEPLEDNLPGLKSLPSGTPFEVTFEQKNLFGLCTLVPIWANSGASSQAMYFNRIPLLQKAPHLDSYLDPLQV